MKFLITGGCGFLGVNIAIKLIKSGYKVIVLDNLTRFGSYNNLEWLKENGDFKFVYGDIRNTTESEDVIKFYKPDVIFHLAAQVAMTTSIENPRLDFETNLVGSFNLLNAVRLYSPKSIIIYSSTNKVYGNLEQFDYRENNTRYECVDKPYGFDEYIKLDFQSPYGTSKGSADQYMLDFARIYGLKTAVFRHSSIYGGRQFSTKDQGWIGWFTQKAIEKKKDISTQKFTISGNGKQVRDILHVSDCVDLYLKACNAIDSISGMAFNIGGGVENSFSLLELIQFLEKELGIELKYDNIAPREGDQKVFIADTRRIKKYIDWLPKIDKKKGIRNMIEWNLELLDK